MNSPVSNANFSLLKATGLAGMGGLLYGGAYTGARQALSREKLSAEEFRNEALANGAGGAASGAGIYLASLLPGMLKRK